MLLLEHEASPNIVDSKGSSPLHLAAWAGHADIVRLLLTSGVRVTQINLKVSPFLIIFSSYILVCISSQVVAQGNIAICLIINRYDYILIFIKSRA